MDSGRWIKVETIENIFEMDLIKDALEREGIDYRIKEHKDTAYDGLFILQKGYASLLAREDQAGAASAIVRRIRSLPYVAYTKD